jgi:hypothetical protein
MNKVNVVRFTPTITEIYQLRDSDIGRGLDEFSSKIGFEDLPEKAARVTGHAVTGD